MRGFLDAYPPSLFHAPFLPPTISLAMALTFARARNMGAEEKTLRRHLRLQCHYADTEPPRRMLHFAYAALITRSSARRAGSAAIRFH